MLALWPCRLLALWGESGWKVPEQSSLRWGPGSGLWVCVEGDPGYRTYPRDTGWSRTRQLGQALGVRGQEDGAGGVAVRSPSRKWEVSTQGSLEGRNNSNSCCLLTLASHVPEHGPG